MTRLKTLSKFDKFLIFFALLVIIYVYLEIKNHYIKSIYTGNETELSGIITDIKLTENRLSITLKSKEKVSLTYYFKEKVTYKLGDEITVKGTMSFPKPNTISNLFNYQNYLLSKKIFYTFKVEEIVKVKDNQSILYKLKNNLISYINNFKSKIYLNTFLLGNNEIDDNVKKSYQLNGISHLFAISGMHITLFSTILLFILNKIFKKEKINYFIITFFLIIYMFLANYSPSVVRGSLLFIFIFFNKLLDLKLNNFKILLLILLFMLIYNPYYIYNVGFLFSFTISFYLIVFGNISNNYKNYFIKLLITSIISFLASIPIVINNYFELNLLSPLLNLLFVPLITFIIFPFSLLTLILPIFDNILLFLIKIMEYLSLIFSNLKFLTITLKSMNNIIYISYYLLIIYILLNLKKKKYYSFLYLIIILLIHNNINYLDKYPTLTMLDVGQGDSILLKLPNNKGNILIDTGGINSFYENNYSIVINKTIPYLKSIGIKKIDYLILTHGDDDHMGDAIDLVTNFVVAKVIINNGNYNDLELELIDILTKKNIKLFQKISELKIDKYKLSFLNTKDYNNENDNSNVIYTEINNIKLLLMGDAGIAKEKDILEKYNLNNIDVLKVGHHGSNTSSSKDFINSINPKICLISVGKDNKFGHPKEVILETLNNCNIYRTDINGSIEIKLKNKLKIKTISQ